MFDDTEYEAQRSQNPGIEPAEIRLKNYQIKSFGSRYDQAVTNVKARDAQLMLQRKLDPDKRKGLLTAQLGSCYDVPEHLQSQTSVETKTKAGSTLYTESIGRF